MGVFAFLGGTTESICCGTPPLTGAMGRFYPVQWDGRYLLSGAGEQDRVMAYR